MAWNLLIAGDATVTPESGNHEALRRLSRDVAAIRSSSGLSGFADASIIAAGSIRIPVNRCVLVARSRFFQEFFSRKPSEEAVDMQKLAPEVEVGAEALNYVLEYVYSGSVGDIPLGVCCCADESCDHNGCRPVVDFAVQVLRASFIFEFFELGNVFQRRLLRVLHCVSIDDTPMILSVAYVCKPLCNRLVEDCISVIERSDLDVIALEKALVPDLVKQIAELRKRAGRNASERGIIYSTYARKIYDALDAGDIESVLRNSPISLDDACALHYAIAHCDPRISTELLERGHADVNRRNHRGYTPLHVAALCREPKILVTLLDKGARPSDVTWDYRKAVQISKRLTRHSDYHKVIEKGETCPKDKLCIEILEQAERDRQIMALSASFRIACDVRYRYFYLEKKGDDVHTRLSYLEMRVSLASMLFPMEAGVAMEYAKVEGTLKFNSGSSPSMLSGNGRATIYLTERPFEIKEEHITRMNALSKTVETGRHYFSRCSTFIDQLLQDESALLACIWRDGRGKKWKGSIDLQDIIGKYVCQEEEYDQYSITSSSSSNTF